MRKNLINSILMLTFVLLVSNSMAQVPQLLNYQGKLVKSDGKAEDGMFVMVFNIYTSETGGTVLWSETRDTVKVTKGVFNVLLGSINAFPGTLFTEPGSRYLGIKVGTGAEMSPRFQLSSVPYAQRAKEADGVANNAITNAKLDNNAVTSDKIQDGQVGTDDLAANAVTSAKISSAQVVKSINNIKDNVTLAAGSNISITPSGSTLTIAAQGVGTGDITAVNAGTGLSGGGTTGDVTLSLNTTYTDGRYVNENQTDAVNSSMIQNGQVGNADLAANAVTSDKIQDGTITAADIGSDAVGSSEIADNAVSSAQINDEPGYNYGNNGDSNALVPLTNAGQSFASVTLVAPAGGFALVIGSAKVFITHTSGTWDNIICKLSKTAGDISTPSFEVVLVRVAAAFPTTSSGNLVFPISITSVFPVTTGANTFYLNAYDSNGTGGDNLNSVKIYAIYLPSRYGTGPSIQSLTLDNQGPDVMLGPTQNEKNE